MKKKEDLITRDWLAIDRTKMANERTLLAYIRTVFVIIGSGLALIKVKIFEDIYGFGYLLVGLAPVILIFGISRFLYVRRHIHKYYKEHQ